MKAQGGVDFAEEEKSSAQGEAIKRKKIETRATMQHYAFCFPELKGKLDGLAVRVPLINGSLTDIVLDLPRDVTTDEINGYLKEASENELKDILGFETQPLVSTDYINDTRSSIVDALSTKVVDKRHLKIYAWYDNEYGYSARMADIANMVAESIM